MTEFDDHLKAIKETMFGESSLGLLYVQFIVEAMRWPVDTFVTRTVSTAGRDEQHVTWLKDKVIGQASYVAAGETTSISATVYPLKNITRVKIGAKVLDDGFTQIVTRSMAVHFIEGQPVTVDLSTFAIWQQREQANEFIDTVLDAVGPAVVA